MAFFPSRRVLRAGASAVLPAAVNFANEVIRKTHVRDRKKKKKERKKKKKKRTKKKEKKNLHDRPIYCILRGSNRLPGQFCRFSNP